MPWSSDSTRRTRAQVQAHAGDLQPAPEIPQRFVELLLAGHAHGEVELAADLVGGLEQVDVVAALGQHRGARETGRPGADHGDAFPRRRAFVAQLGFVTRARVHEAGRDLALEHVVEAGLVAGDARVDLVGASGRGLRDEVRVGEQRPRHRDHVGRAVGEQSLGHLGRVDAVGRARAGSRPGP